MKLLLVSTLLLVGIAFSQQAPVATNDNRVAVESLIKHAEALQERVKNVQTHVGPNYQHLLHELNYQTRLLDALVTSLKNQIADSTKLVADHQFHAMQEKMLLLENRILEEINTIKEVGHNHQYSGETGAQLIARAQKLITDAKAALTSYPKAREVDDIGREIANIEVLEKTIRANASPTQEQLKKYDEELFGHEMTVRLLAEKAALQI